MVPGKLLDRDNHLNERGVIERRAQRLNASKKGLRLLLGNPPPPFSHQQGVQNLHRPKRWHNRGVSRL